MILTVAKEKMLSVAPLVGLLSCTMNVSSFSVMLSALKGIDTSSSELPAGMITVDAIES